MKRAYISLFLVVPMCLLFFVEGSIAQRAGSEKRTITLDGNWEFHQSKADKSIEAPWLPAQVPGDVHMDLLRNKLIPDPYYRDNESGLQWIEDGDWTYRRSFEASSDLLASRNVDLVFLGLDTNAAVIINDRLALTADNMFRSWRIDAKRFLRPGSNEIRVEFTSPIKVANELAAGDKTHADTRIPEKSYLRKAAYEYGWDWGPRFVTSGIWQSVDLEVWDKARISEVQIGQPDVRAEVAHLSAKINIIAGDQFAAVLKLAYVKDGTPVETLERAQLHPGNNTVEIPLEIVMPALWFPSGYGPQNLYTFKATLQESSQRLDEKVVRTGLRSVVLHRKPDQWGRSFEFVVNGIPVFIKGADVIPFDSFPNRVTEARYRQALQSAKDANMNMVRLWGGGYYESDKFYDLCDELGLMVWNDFMFASSWYPGSEDWKQKVEEESEYQVNRIRNHPSIALWSGNNEVESVLNAFLGGLPPDARLQVWKNYLTIFSGVLARVVERDDPEIPYWPSSPSSDYEETSDKFQAGDAHDWSIWHGREPFANYKKHFYRFTSEYGFQSFPELRTVESFTTPEDRASIFTPVMLAHQKNNEGNSIIHEYLLRDYAEPKDFASFLYVSQVLQAEGIKVGAEHMRRSRPRIMGSLIWQLNDCWPVASWSSIDYYGRWKALQYYARRFYSPILVSPLVEDAKVAVYVVSDQTQATNGILRARVMTTEGETVMELKKAITLPPLSSDTYLEAPFESLLKSHKDLSKLVVLTDFAVNGAIVSSNINYLTPTKQVHLLAAKIESALTQDGDAYDLKLSSNVLARDVYVTFGELDAQASDNFVDLIPGEPVMIKVSSTAGLEELKMNLKVTSLVDAFVPESAVVKDSAPAKQ
jgi:beta-mannosidase